MQCMEQVPRDNRRPGLIRSGTVSVALAVLVTTAVADTPGQGADDVAIVAETSTLLVGATGIYCVTTPCPWKGVQRIEADGVPVLLWSGDALPRIRASDADAREVHEAWEAGDCVLVTGSLDETHLVVQSIDGTC